MNSFKFKCQIHKFVDPRQRRRPTIKHPLGAAQITQQQHRAKQRCTVGQEVSLRAEVYIQASSALTVRAREEEDPSRGLVIQPGGYAHPRRKRKSARRRRR